MALAIPTSSIIAAIAANRTKDAHSSSVVMSSSLDSEVCRDAVIDYNGCAPDHATTRTGAIAVSGARLINRLANPLGGLSPQGLPEQLRRAQLFRPRPAAAATVPRRPEAETNLARPLQLTRAVRGHNRGTLMTTNHALRPAPL